MKKFLTAFLQLFPVILSLLILAAHFSRADNTFFMIIALILIAVLFIQKPLTARIVQIALVLGTLEWVRTTYYLAAGRIENDQSWIRLVTILGFVSLFTLASALVFYREPLKKRYGLNNEPEFDARN